MTARARTWLVECYAPGIRSAAVAGEGDRIRAAAEIAMARGAIVEYLGALLVAGDEAVFHAFDADDETVVAEVARRAGLGYARIVESVAVSAPGFADALTRLLDAAPTPRPR